VRALLLSFLCGLAPVPPAGAADQLRLVSFSTVLTEIAEQVGGPHTKVAGLVIAGEDPHEYQPTPADLDQVSQANLVLLSGKHIVAAASAEPNATLEDPHWWHSITNVKKATGFLADELVKLDPANQADYKKYAKPYLATLNPKVTSEITRETGVNIGGTLYADGLGTGPASTYEGMVRLNVSRIVSSSR
jgi:ABC-type Zn uptake system ZnuABC Zn-binding protein ZnuA